MLPGEYRKLARMTQDVDGAERGQEKLPAAWRGRNFKCLDGKSKTPSGVWQGSNVVGKRYRHAYPFELGKQFLGLRQTPGLAFFGLSSLCFRPRVAIALAG